MATGECIITEKELRHYKACCDAAARMTATRYYPADGLIQAAIEGTATEMRRMNLVQREQAKREVATAEARKRKELGL